ncbi:S-layer homology domain-containing protein [Lutispora saccharofermentans]|uniref:S-layer homology domain-containing protein n=1 Tax=Lutispora saccharofermentans TaxID=3024236 RepID=A0ABT1NA96_9FIRM|nr:S-layer homology domain-containing protein [Lutispora saccharofermentans]MCQ1528180.1 S-layer homology domain-containing protein [Lutispora saccharofermentans]
MKNMKITALCLSAAIAISAVTTPVLAYADNDKAKLEVKGKMTINMGKTSKSKNSKLNPGNLNFKFCDSKDYMENMAWAMKAIEKLGAKGIISGYSDKSYKPQNKVTNMEALTLILKLTGREDESEKNNKVHPIFNQYQSNWNLQWGWGYLFVAVDKGILLPEEIKGFNPNQPIKRHELAKYLIRAIGKSKDAEEYMNSKLDFKDADAVPKASRGYVYLINDLGIMTGNENRQFKPNEPLTRAEIAVLIDKAGDYLDDYEDNQNEAKVVFKAYDDTNNKLTAIYNGKTVYYKTIDNVIVYKDNEYTDIYDLSEGDVLDIVLGSDKQVIFIEVIGYTDDEDDDDEDREYIDFTDVSYSKLPASIQRYIDTSRATKGYKAYKYNDAIYLAAFMGRKNTGGYSIEIEDIQRYKLNGKYIVEAVVKETEPDKDSFVTQALTYPYTVVKFDSFDNISKVNFVDENGNVLSQKSIEALKDEATTASGIFSKADDAYIYIKAGTNSVLTKYEMAEDIQVYINNKEKSLDDLKSGMKVKLTILNDLVTKISADYEVKDAEGTIQLVDTAKKQIRIKYENRFTTYSIEEDAEVTLDGEASELSKLEFGMKVNLELLNSKVVRIDAVNFEETFEGKIKNIEIANKKVKSITLLVDKSQMKFDITADTSFDMLDSDAEPTDLAINSEVKINLLNGKAIEVIELK